jgi:hypothetical protein
VALGPSPTRLIELITRVVGLRPQSVPRGALRRPVSPGDAQGVLPVWQRPQSRLRASGAGGQRCCLLASSRPNMLSGTRRRALGSAHPRAPPTSPGGRQPPSYSLALHYPRARTAPAAQASSPAPHTSPVPFGPRAKTCARMRITSRAASIRGSSGDAHFFSLCAKSSLPCPAAPVQRVASRPAEPRLHRAEEGREPRAGVP